MSQIKLPRRTDFRAHRPGASNTGKPFTANTGAIGWFLAGRICVANGYSIGALPQGTGTNCTCGENAGNGPPSASVQEDIDLSDRMVARNRDQALQYLEQVQRVSPLAAINVKTHLTINDNVPLAIHEIVDQEKIDMVALNAHGYSGNNQWPYGSMVNNFILYGKVPLLIVQDHPVQKKQVRCI